MDLKCEFVLTQSLATSDFNVNVGQETSLTEGQGERMVSQLCKDIEEHSYRVYCYNIFYSVLLLESLQVYACGTVWRDQKVFPNVLKPAVTEK